MVETSYSAAARSAYDGVAAVYAARFAGALVEQPLDRAVLTGFAEMSGATGPVVDVGCGPGHGTAFMGSLGVDVTGVDVSPTMIALARERYPRIAFEVGSMTRLRHGDASVGGVIAWYSFIHFPPDHLGPVIAEMGRVLVPGGYLLLACHGVDRAGDATSVFDHAVLPAYRWSPDDLVRLLRENGFDDVARLSRAPSKSERFQQIRIIARR